MKRIIAFASLITLSTLAIEKNPLKPRLTKKQFIKRLRNQDRVEKQLAFFTGTYQSETYSQMIARKEAEAVAPENLIWLAVFKAEAEAKREAQAAGIEKCRAKNFCF